MWQKFKFSATNLSRYQYYPIHTPLSGSFSLHTHRLKHTPHVVNTPTTEGNGIFLLQLAEDFEKWLYGFSDTEKSVRETVEAIINHPLIPHYIAVHGFIIDSHTRN